MKYEKWSLTLTCSGWTEVDAECRREGKWGPGDHGSPPKAGMTAKDCGAQEEDMDCEASRKMRKK